MPDYGPLVIGVCLSATAVSGLFLVLRLYCKVDRSRGLWWDDYVLIAAWVRYPIRRQPFPFIL